MMKTMCLIALRLPGTGVMERPAHAVRQVKQTRARTIKYEPLPRAASVRPNETTFNEQPSWKRRMDSDRDGSGLQLGVGFQAKQYISAELRGSSSHSTSSIKSHRV